MARKASTLGIGINDNSAVSLLDMILPAIFRLLFFILLNKFISILTYMNLHISIKKSC